jgi:hypothetical protein
MTGARELFESFTESDSDMYVELGMGTKHAVKGSGTVPFQMESGGVLRVTNVLWVPELRRSVLSVSTIEKKGFDCMVLLKCWRRYLIMFAHSDYLYICTFT